MSAGWPWRCRASSKSRAPASISGSATRASSGPIRSGCRAGPGSSGLVGLPVEPDQELAGVLGVLLVDGDGVLECLQRAARGEVPAAAGGRVGGGAEDRSPDRADQDAGGHDGEPVVGAEDAEQEA